jgi:transcription initiation factor TFIIIB Brf1 subunit/transcription initiation factor TFIIB
VLCRDISAKRVIKSSSRLEHAAAALYLATKLRGGGASRSRKEIARHFSMAVERLTAVSKLFVKLVGPQHPLLLETRVTTEDLIHRAVDRMDLPLECKRRLKNKAHEMAATVDARLVEGKTPCGVCGGVLAAAGEALGMHLDRKRIAEATLVSAATVDKMARLLFSSACVNAV